MILLQDAYKRFQMETGGGVSPREQLLKQLAAGHDTFMELMGNLQEGSKVCRVCPHYRVCRVCPH